MGKKDVHGLVASGGKTGVSMVEVHRSFCGSFPLTSQSYHIFLQNEIAISINFDCIYMHCFWLLFISPQFLLSAAGWGFSYFSTSFIPYSTVFSPLGQLLPPIASPFLCQTFFLLKTEQGPETPGKGASGPFMHSYQNLSGRKKRGGPSGGRLLTRENQ